MVVVLSSVIGDTPLTAAQTADLLQHGPAWLGVLASFVVAVGLRSGSFGGPLALERPEVRHVLLAPVDRTAALRAPAIRRLRFLLFVGSVTGAIAGQLAHHRIEGATAAWIAHRCAGRRHARHARRGRGVRGQRAATCGPGWPPCSGWCIVGLSVANGLGTIGWGPGEPFGELVLWPLEWSALGLVPIALAIVLVAVGLARLGHTSLEAAERRSHLVGQLRFAATMQDLRTVVVLRRQLALELPRLRPWIRVRSRPGGRFPVLTRGVQGLLRWPGARVARLGLLGVLAGLALRGAWAGTTPLIVLAGVAMFVAGLDTVEALAQEVDHPSRRDSSPLDPGLIHLRHVPMGVAAQALVAAIAAAAAAAPGGHALPASVAAVVGVSMALGAAAGAIVSVLSGPASTGGSWSMAPPEAQGMRLAFRSAWPPALAVIGTLPVLAARSAVESGDPADGPALTATLGVAVVFVLVCGWVRLREEIGAWFGQQMEQSGASR